jgi:hypothetical protein
MCPQEKNRNNLSKKRILISSVNINTIPRRKALKKRTPLDEACGAL